MNDISTVRLVFAVAFMGAGFIFMFLSALGILRFPDFLSRLHASSVGETVGIAFTCIGLIIFQGLDLVSAKIVLIIIAVMVANPVGTHLIGKSALRAGEAETAEKKERTE